MRSRNRPLVLSLVAFAMACGGQTTNDIGQTSPSTGGTGGAGGGAAGATTATGGSVAAMGIGGTTSTAGSGPGGSGSSTGGAGTAGTSAGGPAAGTGGGSGGQGAGGGVQACCTSDLECGAGHECVLGNCLPFPTPPHCWKHTDCLVYQACAVPKVYPCGPGNQPVPKPGWCEGTAGGGGGAAGNGGSGGFPACCGPTAPCPSGYSCVDTICVPPPPPGQCWSDLDCQFPGPGTWQCIGGKVCPCNADCNFTEVLVTCGMVASGGCPASLPQSGTPCAPDGLACPFGPACCGPEAFCMNGSWFLSAPNCPVPQGCPSSPPASGDACCGFQPSCAWDECNTVGQVQATCDNGTGTWTVSTTSCDMAGPICNGKPCNASEICVEYQGGAGITYSCQPDPCGASPLSCGCAASLCAPPQSCLVTDSQHPTCTCDLCP